MGEKEIRIGGFLKFTFMKHYKQHNQVIVGVTANKEHERFRSNSLYEAIGLKRAKWEFNIWLFLISFHMTVYGKLNTD